MVVLRLGLLVTLATAAVTPNDRVHDIPIPVSLSQANGLLFPAAQTCSV